MSVLAIMAAAALAAPSDAPVRRQAVADLAYALGEVHALHRLCAGDADDTWRGKMQSLLSAEAPDEGYRRRLLKRFNSGYLQALATHPRCGPESVEAERRAMGEGARLALTVAGGADPRGNGPAR